MKKFFAVNIKNQVFDEGLIALAKLPKLEKLTIVLRADDNNISDEVFKHFTSLKSLELLCAENLSNETLLCIVNNCLELQSLIIDSGSKF